MKSLRLSAIKFITIGVVSAACSQTVPNYRISILSLNDPIMVPRSVIANNVGQVLVETIVSPSNTGAAILKLTDLKEDGFAIKLAHTPLSKGTDHNSVTPVALRDAASPLHKGYEALGNLVQPKPGFAYSGARWTGGFGQLGLTTVYSAVYPSTGDLNLVGIDSDGAFAGNTDFQVSVSQLKGFHRVSVASPFTFLADYSFGNASVTAMAGDGALVGTAPVTTQSSTRQCSVLWTNASAQASSICESGWQASSPTDVAKVGANYWVVGTYSTPTTPSGIYRISLGSFPTVVFAPSSTSPKINSTGYMVTSDSIIPPSLAATPVLFSSRITNPGEFDGRTLRVITDISDNGQLFGYAYRPNEAGKTVSFVATPLLASPRTLTLSLHLPGWVGTASNIPARAVAYDVLMGVAMVSSGAVPVSSNNIATIPIENTGPCIVRLRLIGGPTELQTVGSLAPW
jgi:hypothetical protein